MLLSKIQYLNVQNPCLPRIVDMRNKEVKVILLFPKGVREIEDRRTVMQKFLLRTQCKFFLSALCSFETKQGCSFFYIQN